MKKYAPLILAISLLSSPAKADDIESLLRTCSNKSIDHVQQTECLDAAASESQNALSSAESAFQEYLSKATDVASEDIQRVHNAFSERKHAFEAYRTKQCDFYAAMAMGGNGGHDVRLACTAVLNNEQAQQLRWTVKYWK